VALAFDEGPSFAIDKPAGLPCPHLDHHACTLHSRLETWGFSGCAAYDCEGAGQRTVALYDGASWQDDLTVLAPMLETFRHLRAFHSLIGVLDTARRLPLEDEEIAQLEHLQSKLCDPDLSPQKVEDLAKGTLQSEAKAFLRSLAHHV